MYRRPLSLRKKIGRRDVVSSPDFFSEGEGTYLHRLMKDWEKFSHPTRKSTYPQYLVTLKSPSATRLNVARDRNVKRVVWYLVTILRFLCLLVKMASKTVLVAHCSSFLVLVTTGIFRGALWIRKPRYLRTYGIKKKKRTLTLKCRLQNTDKLQTSCKVQNPHRIDVKNSVSHWWGHIRSLTLSFC